MPTEFEMRKRNNKFANDVRAGKQATHQSRQDKLAKRSPLNLWALGVIVFVVIGGVVFELIKIIFL
uniref:Stress-associated endoplasmic reticulum protein n=1 Tax=Psilocybe cubensis TaxID=181762 RepID=A0A8H7Y5B5_PSICU